MQYPSKTIRVVFAWLVGGSVVATLVVTIVVRPAEKSVIVNQPPIALSPQATPVPGSFPTSAFKIVADMVADTGSVWQPPY